MSRPGQNYEPILAGWAVGSIIADICDRAGIPYYAYDSSLVEGFCDGFSTNNGHSAASAISALSGIYLFDPANYDGSLNFIPRGNEPIAVITIDDLVDNSDSIEQSSRRDPITIPRVMNLEYYDTEGGLTADKQTSDRSIGERSVSVSTTETVVIMRADDAAQAATIGHKIAIEEQDGEKEFSLPDKWCWLTVSDVIIYLGQRVRITEIKFDDGQQHYKAIADRQSSYETTIQGLPIDQPSAPPDLVVADSVMEFIDCHILRSGDDTLGYYVAIAGESTDWEGAVVELSKDGGVNWIGTGAYLGSCTMGVTTTALGTHSVDYRDDVNTVTVELIREDMELITATQTEMMNRVNLAIIGDELVNFSEVTQTGPKTWDISGFLRGRKGSPMTSHAAGQRFVLLDLNDIVFTPAELFELNRSLTFRITSIGADTESAIFTVTLLGRSQQERQPAYLHAIRSGSDLIVTWQGVGRIGGGASVAMGQYFSGYRITLGANTYNTTERTLTIPYAAGTLSVRQVNAITGIGPAISVAV